MCTLLDKSVSNTQIFMEDSGVLLMININKREKKIRFRFLCNRSEIISSYQAIYDPNDI
jgi:hypothetical protein